MGSGVGVWARTVREQREAPVKSKTMTVKARAVTRALLYSASHPCQGARMFDKTPTIPGWDLPLGTEVEIEITVRVVKLGREPRGRCQNPWPAHYCDDGKHYGPFGRKTLRKKRKSR
jgi:hypothetical protein